MPALDLNLNGRLSSLPNLIPRPSMTSDLEIININSIIIPDLQSRPHL